MPSTSVGAGATPTTTSASEVFDLGRVDLTRGPVRKDHQFQIANLTDSVVEVREIKPTCGCIGCTVDQRRIDPGEVTNLLIAFDIHSPGQITHGARVLLSNNTVMEYMLTAYGEMGVELTPIRDTACIRGEDRTHSLRLYRVHSDGLVLASLPTVIEPSGIDLHAGSWELIEDGAGGLRPARQIIDIQLDFSTYTGTFPVEIVMTTDDGGRAAFLVYEPSGLPER